MAEPKTRRSTELLEEAMPIAQELHRMMREMDLDLMIFIAALHIADRLAVFYWLENEIGSIPAERVEYDAARVREIVSHMSLGLLAKRPAQPGSPGVVDSITVLDRPLTEKPKPGKSN